MFYGSRDVGCARLDSDNRGFLDEVITLADGSQTKVESNKETIQLRCIEPGHYDLGVHLYEYRDKNIAVSADRRDLGLRVHVEIVKLNPTVRVVFAKDVTLDRVWQTINVESFDMDRDGKITLRDPPLDSVLDHYYRRTNPNGGAP